MYNQCIPLPSVAMKSEERLYERISLVRSTFANAGMVLAVNNAQDIDPAISVNPFQSSTAIARASLVSRMSRDHQ